MYISAIPRRRRQGMGDYVRRIPRVSRRQGMGDVIDDGKELYDKYFPRLKSAYEAYRAGEDGEEVGPAESPFTPVSTPAPQPPSASPWNTGRVALAVLGGIVVVSGATYFLTRKRR